MYIEWLDTCLLYNKIRPHQRAGGKRSVIDIPLKELTNSNLLKDESTRGRLRPTQQT